MKTYKKFTDIYKEYDQCNLDKGLKRSGSRKGLFLGGLSEKTNKNFKKKVMKVSFLNHGPF